MNHFMYYPQQRSMLDDIATSIQTPVLAGVNNIKILREANRHINPDKFMQSHQPVIIPGHSSASLRSPILSPVEHRTLKSMSHDMGGIVTAATAELFSELQEAEIPRAVSDTNTFGAAGFGAAARASKFMLDDVIAYDKSLKEYHDYKNHNAAPDTIARAKAKMDDAFKKMHQSLNKRGQDLLQKHAFKTREVVNQTGRIVRESIPLADNTDVQRLAKMAKAGRVLGPGVIALDGYLRYNKVSTMKGKDHPKWQREAFIQAVGFAAGIGTGIAVAFIVAPLGVGLILGAFVAGAAAIVSDSMVSKIAGTLYDGYTE